MKGTLANPKTGTRQRANRDTQTCSGVGQGEPQREAELAHPGTSTGKCDKAALNYQLPKNPSRRKKNPPEDSSQALNYYYTLNIMARTQSQLTTPEQ